MGSLNLAAITAVRKYERGIMCTGQSVGRMNRLLEKWGGLTFGLNIQEMGTRYGEGYGFDLENLLRYGIKKFGLEAKATTTSIEIKQSFDGGELTKKMDNVHLFGIG